MNMIEIDPFLFITCRLCTDEKGVYQIVPEIQKKIKYCFDLDISLHDGLPPLICKKCEAMLTHHAEIKQMVHEKQKILLKKFKANHTTAKEEDEIQTSQLSTVEEVHNRNEDDKNTKENNFHKIESLKNKKGELIKNSSDNKTLPPVDETKFTINSTENKLSKNEWKRDYKKQFVCRFCSASLKHKRNMIFHGERCVLKHKYENLYKWCCVKLNNINSNCNITESKDNIMYEKNKIINTKNENYCVIYTLKSKSKNSSSESSDENFTRSKKKRKRQRLMSESSNDTVVLDNAINKENEIECVTLEDSDNGSTLSTEADKLINMESNSTVDNIRKITNEKIVNNIVNVCYKKYLKRLSNVGKNTKKKDSFLQRKLLSIGRKTIHKDGFHQTGLLRYMEQKDLDVTWIPKLEAPVTVRTTLKENMLDDKLDFKSLCVLDNNYKTIDFVDTFEQLFMSETVSTVLPKGNTKQDSSNNVVSNTNTGPSQNVILVDTPKVFNTYEKIVKNRVVYLQTKKEPTNVSNNKKLLNPNPVANPKKLINTYTEVTTNTKKHDETLVSHTSATEKSKATDTCLSLPIITSTVSLAPTFKNVKPSDQSSSYIEVDAAPKPLEPPLPRIKVKPVSELMAEKPTSAPALDKPKGAPVPASVWSGNSTDVPPPPPSLMPNVLSNIILTPNPVYVSLMQPNNVTFPVFQTAQINNFNQATPNVPAPLVAAPQVNDNRDCMTMHTVELPRKKTHSPFLYFKELLQIHNMNLIDSAECTSVMSCIIKFKLRFEQSGIAPVTLCLTLLCHNNNFCIQVRDLNSRILDVNEFSAYWQWEVLKGFRGDVVNMMLNNAKKLSLEILERITYFVSLLSTITVTGC